MGRLYRVVNRTTGRMGFYEEGNDQPTYLAPDAGGTLNLAPGQVVVAKRCERTNDIELELIDDRGEETEDTTRVATSEFAQATATRATAPTSQVVPKDPPPTTGHLLVGLSGNIEGLQLIDGGKERISIDNLDALQKSAAVIPEDGELSLTIDTARGDVAGTFNFDGGVLVSITIGDAEFFLTDLLEGRLPEDVETKDDAEAAAEVDPIKTYDDDQLRAIIKDKTGKDPHPAAKRSTLETKAREALGLPPTGEAATETV